MADYGDRFETGTIVAMAIAIVVSLILVFVLNIAVHDSECSVTEYTYCGETPAPH